MRDILNEAYTFVQNEINKENNLKTIIDNMILTDYFDFISTICIYLQDNSSIIAFTEWKIDRLGYSIYDESEPLIVPMPITELLFSRFGEFISISLATEKETEEILLKKLKTKEKITYYNYVFYNLLDTTCKEYDNFLNTNLYYLTEFTPLALKTLCEKTGIEVISEDISKLKRDSFFSFDGNKLFLDDKLGNYQSLFHMLKHFLWFLFMSTTTQNNDTVKFEYDLCFYVMCKKLCLNSVPKLPLLDKNINLLDSVPRIFKICEFILNNIKEVEQTADPNTKINYEKQPESKKGFNIKKEN